MIKIPETIKWAVGVAALVLLPQNTTWPAFFVQTSDYYAEMRLAPKGTVVVIAKNSGSRPVQLSLYGPTFQTVRRISTKDDVIVRDGKIPPEAYSVTVAPESMRPSMHAKQEDQLVNPGRLQMFTPAEMTHYVVTILIIVAVAVMLTLLVREVREKAGV